MRSLFTFLLLWRETKNRSRIRSQKQHFATWLYNCLKIPSVKRALTLPRGGKKQKNRSSAATLLPRRTMFRRKLLPSKRRSRAFRFRFSSLLLRTLETWPVKRKSRKRDLRSKGRRERSATRQRQYLVSFVRASKFLAVCFHWISTALSPGYFESTEIEMVTVDTWI